MWNGKKKAVTFSFDDGVTQDIRLIEILNRYGLTDSKLKTLANNLMQSFDAFNKYVVAMNEERRQLNDNVDVLGTFRFPDLRGDNSLDTVTITILQNVKVLAVGNRWHYKNPTLPSNIELDIEREVAFFDKDFVNGTTAFYGFKHGISSDYNTAVVGIRYACITRSFFISIFCSSEVLQVR